MRLAHWHSIVHTNFPFLWDCWIYTSQRNNYPEQETIPKRTALPFHRKVAQSNSWIYFCGPNIQSRYPSTPRNLYPHAQILWITLLSWSWHRALASTWKICYIGLCLIVDVFDGCQSLFQRSQCVEVMIQKFFPLNILSAKLFSVLTLSYFATYSCSFHFIVAKRVSTSSKLTFWYFSER
jgi:hypothetical protein